jgi:hypothetical protein
MAKRLHKTLLDYLIIAISPALIILMVNSLVQFLVQVFYRGNFQGRLDFVLTMFVVGAVLIGRISIEDGRERAMLFAAPLGLVTLLAIGRFVEFHGLLGPFSFFINCGLIALIWWSADKLTWDCTLIDEQEEDSGEGLLETVGLDRPDHAAVQREIAPVADAAAMTSRDDVPTSWWDRFVERRRRPHAPGVWVVYFSLAALPLFAIGQMLLSSGDTARRQEAFRHLFVYTGSGLGLLLSTSFLGLRRYLRQRLHEMPLQMVNLWLGIGAGLIVAVMFLALLLPRPNAEYAISQIPIEVGSPDQKASPVSTGGEGVEEKRPDAQREARKDAPQDSPQSDKTGQSTSGDGKKSTDGKQEPGKEGQKSSDSDNTKQNPSENSSRQPGEKGNDGRSANDQGKSPAEQSKKSEADSGEPEKKEQKSKPADGSGDAAQRRPENSPEKGREGGSTGKTPPKFSLPHVGLPSGVSFFAAAFKWLLYIAIAAVIGYLLWTKRVEVLAALRDFRQALADLWNRLFGQKPSPAEVVAAEEATKAPAVRHFTDFTDPFAKGVAGRYPPEELVRYTFEALEAWARDNGHPRLPDQTPHEFARSIGVAPSPLSDNARYLAELYCQVAYAPGTLPPASVSRLSRLWQEMRAAVLGPASGRKSEEIAAEAGAN